MDFTNTEILTANVPQIEEVHYHPLEKHYLRVKRIAFFTAFFMLGVLLAAVYIFIPALQQRWLIIAATFMYLVLAALAWMADTLSFRFSGYVLREKDVLYRSGWFIQKTRMVPLSRIQHVSVQSGPIERSFGLASVSIFTAGAGQADFTIRGITQTTANQIKDWLTTLMNTEHDQD